MGHVTHNAIIVTSWNENIDEAHAKAVEIGCLTTSVTTDAVNGYRTFLVAPDGSKSGWTESDEGDARREAFKEWLRSQRYEDQSSPFEWVEVQYGSDDARGFDMAPTVVDHEWIALTGRPDAP